MRRIATIAFAGILAFSSAAFAGDGALSAGHPAGVQKAQLGTEFTLYAAGGIIAAAGLALLINGVTSKGPAAPAGGTTTAITTTSTSATTTTG